MIEIMKLLENINKTMRGFGFTQKISLGNDNVEITESEVIMKIPFSLKLKIPKEDFGDKSDDAISRAVSKAISRARSLNK